MMLKAIIYAYMNNIYSCRKIEKLLLRDIHFIWLAGNEHPDFITINRFRNRVKEEINNVFTQLVLVLADKGFISLDVEYIDGTKIESKANKYTFVWRKTAERNRTRLMDKIHILLEQVDEDIAQENSVKDTSAQFTPTMLTLTLIPFFHSFQHQYDRLPTVGVADSGYGSEENYRFMQERGIEAFVKYNYFHKEQRPRYTPDPFHAESLHYNAEGDYYVCPMGQHMKRIGTKRDKTASGYSTESARYKAQRCEGRPLHGSCFKAQGNRIIEVNHRLKQYKRQARERLL